MNKVDTEKNRRKAKEKLTGYDVYLADSSLLAPLEAEKKPKIIIMCPNQQAMDDVEQLLQALSLLPPPCNYEAGGFGFDAGQKIKPCETCRTRETCGAKGELCNDYSRDETLPTYQTTSVLPKQPCERCGGSGFVPNPAYIKHCKDKENIPRHMRTRDNPYPTTIPCPACQVPAAGKVEEFLALLQKERNCWSEHNSTGQIIEKACIHLTAQAKQIKELEDGAFAANEEAQAKNDQIKRLEAANKGLEEEVWKLMLEMVKGSKGERQRINAELLEKRREAFGIQKG